MLNLKQRLAGLESRLQKIIEGGVGRLLPGGRQYAQLPDQLLDALQDGLQVDPDGQLLAPNLYVLLVPPDQVESFQDKPGLLEALTAALLEAAEEAGVAFPSPPVLRVLPELSLPQGQVQVLAHNSLEDISQTTEALLEPDLPAGVIPENAFLIVDGTSIFTLEAALVNIGRRPDNHLVLRDERVSRLHAQLRAIEGRYVIFDLDSTGGTQVNGQPVKEQVLSPGDVISLSGLPLVYGQDEEERSQTQDLYLGA
jgi:hypothetical protein